MGYGRMLIGLVMDMMVLENHMIMMMDGSIERQGSSPSATFNASDWTACKDCLESTTNAGGSTPFPLKSFTSNCYYDYVQSSDTLKLEDVGTSASGYQI